MPPGLSRRFAPSKNSRVKSAAVPFTHGSTMSDVITSNVRSVVIRKCRASSNSIRVLGFGHPFVVVGEEGRDEPRHERLDLGDDHPLDTGRNRQGARRHARAKPDHQDVLRLRRQQVGEMAEHALKPHVFRQA